MTCGMLLVSTSKGFGLVVALISRYIDYFSSEPTRDFKVPCFSTLKERKLFQTLNNARDIQEVLPS